MLPDEIIIRPGITAIINGEEMTSQEAEESSARPRILAGYPQEDEMGPNKASFIYQTNKPGKVYWAVTLEEDEDEIDEDDIIKPNNVKKIISSGTFTVKNAEEDVTSSVSKLTADTDYVISAVLEDERGNISLSLIHICIDKMLQHGLNFLNGLLTDSRLDLWRYKTF